MSIKEIVRDNLLALLRHDAGGEMPARQSGPSALSRKAGKTAPSWGQRYLDETDIGISRLEEVAKLWGLQPWQLLVPELDPDRPPTISGDVTAWPLPMVDQKEYRSLGPEDRAWVQSKMDSAIKDRIEELRKRKAA